MVASRCDACDGSRRSVEFAVRRHEQEDDTDATIDGLRAEVEAMSDALDFLWGSLYGKTDWEYPGQAVNHALQAIGEARRDRSALLDAARKAQGALMGARGWIPGSDFPHWGEVEAALSALSAVLTPNSQPGSSSVGVCPGGSTVEGLGKLSTNSDERRALAERVRRVCVETAMAGPYSHAQVPLGPCIESRSIAARIQALDLSPLLGGSDAA